VSTKGLVLRVLAGGNAGAELPLADGAWLLGRGPEADITLAEPALAPEQLRLTVAAGAVTITVLAEGVGLAGRPLAAGTEQALPLGQLLVVGATRFALGSPGTDWRAAQAEATQLTDAPSPQREAPRPAPGSAGAAPTPGAPARRAILGRALAVLALVVLPLGLLGGSLWLALDAMPKPTSAAAPTEAATELRRVVAALGMAERLTVDSGDNGRPALSGQLRDEEELRRLVAELRRAGLSPELAVVTETEMASLAGMVLRGFEIEAEVTVTGPGRVRLRGLAADDAALTQAVARLRADVPGLRQVEDAIATPERARAALEARLREGGLGRSLRLSGTERRLTVNGVLAVQEMPAWAETERWFKESFPGMALEARVATPGIAAPRGVHLGRQAFLILEDGRRVRVGDVLDGAGRVLDIDIRRVRVQNAAGTMDLPYARSPGWITEDRDVPAR